GYRRSLRGGQRAGGSVLHRRGEGHVRGRRGRLHAPRGALGRVRGMGYRRPGLRFLRADIGVGKGDPIMRFMFIVKATQDSEAGVMPEEKLFAAMAGYHEELQKAGVLLDASGLKPSAQGWRVKYDGEKRTVIDGPFAEVKELIAGYTLIQVKSREEAMEWARRFPNPAVDGKEGEVEVRQLFELEDFGPSEAVERFREMEALK